MSTRICFEKDGGGEPVPGIVRGLVKHWFHYRKHFHISLGSAGPILDKENVV